MARLSKGKQRLAFGCYYTMEPGKRFPGIIVALHIKWYGWPVLMWKRTHELYQLKWHQYPYLFWLIGKHTLLKWMGK